jgi:F-type H+-transporting ATPase subunit b
MSAMKITAVKMTAVKMTALRKIVPPALFALLLGTAFVCVHADDQAQAKEPSNPPQQQQAQPAQSQPSQNPPSEPEVKQTPPNRGIGQQLAHETREAAGEDQDETAEFKQSSSVRLVSHLTGLDLRSAYWLCVLTNFLVIVLVLIWAARKFLPGAFRARTAAIQKAMQEAQKASAEARARLAEIESRLKKLDAEIDSIRDEAEKEGAAEEARIQAAAEDDARKIVASAEQEIAAAAKAARRELTAYAADLAVALAQKQIHVDAATDQALVRNFSGQLGAENNGWEGQRPDVPRKDGQ